MRKGTLITIIVLSLSFVIIGRILIEVNNNLATMEKQIYDTERDMRKEIGIQADVLPILLEVLNERADDKQDTLLVSINAINEIISPADNPANLITGNMAELKEQKQKISLAIEKSLIAIEQYPDLKASERFQDLQIQLNASEDRIATQQIRFDETVENYNAYIRQFPNNLFASLLGFTQKKRD